MKFSPLYIFALYVYIMPLIVTFGVHVTICLRICTEIHIRKWVILCLIVGYCCIQNAGKNSLLHTRTPKCLCCIPQCQNFFVAFHNTIISLLYSTMPTFLCCIPQLQNILVFHSTPRSRSEILMVNQISFIKKCNYYN